MPRDRLAARIGRRIEKMFADGLVEEAVALRAAGGLSPTAAGAIGYAEALAVADGQLSRDEAATRIAARTRQLAKRQFTWFRHQIDVDWIEVADDDTPATLGPKVLEIWKRNGYFELVL
jgi:tRNA dimethylallyltransferase